MQQKTDFLNTIPVLPSADIARDVKWYYEKMGLETFFADRMYAILYRITYACTCNGTLTQKMIPY